MCFWMSFDEPCSLGEIRKNLMRKNDLQNLSGKPEIIVLVVMTQELSNGMKDGKQEVGCRKRKKVVQEEGERSNIMAKYLKVIQNEGLPKQFVL